MFPITIVNVKHILLMNIIVALVGIGVVIFLLFDVKVERIFKSRYGNEMDHTPENCDKVANRILWILFWFVAGCILANSLGCARDRLTVVVKHVQSDVEVSAKYESEW
jgi:hypothetical protein